MHLIAATFDRNLDAEAAREELAETHGGLDVKLRFRRIDQLVDPVGAHPVIIGRVPEAAMRVLGVVVARHHRQVVIDLDEAYV